MQFAYCVRHRCRLNAAGAYAAEPCLVQPSSAFIAFRRLYDHLGVSAATTGGWGAFPGRDDGAGPASIQPQCVPSYKAWFGRISSLMRDKAAVDTLEAPSRVRLARFI